MRDYNHFLFYSNEISDNSLTLDPTETNHAVKVLRLNAGDPFKVTDGKGTIYLCTLDKTASNSACASIINRQQLNRHDTHIHLNIGIPDRESLENALVDCTALGIERITPVICDFCQDPWWKRSWERDSERLKNKMISSMKQSLYPFLPVLDNPVKVDTALENICGLKIAADQYGKSIGMCNISSNTKISCFVGPPGGFSPDELSKLSKNEFCLVKIAYTRLRTELAATVICAQIMAQSFPNEN